MNIINVLEKQAKKSKNSDSELLNILQCSDIRLSDYKLALSNIAKYSRIAIHFHPDRLDANNISVLQNLYKSGFYKNQFETKTSNGLLDPNPNGLRAHWENRLFGQGYSSIEVTKRPKYGSLNVFNHSDGPSPRFGSSYFVLNPRVNQNCTFTYLDSYLSPNDYGTTNQFDTIMYKVLKEAFDRGEALGIKDLTPSSIIDFLLNKNNNDNLLIPYDEEHSENLDFYVETQIHQKVNLYSDVDHFVVDPSFLGTDLETLINLICTEFNIKLHYHQGYSLDINDVPSNYRGATMPSLAKKIAQNGIVNAYAIGCAAENLKNNPESWLDRGDYNDCLQELKKLWHVLVKFG